MRLSRVHLIAAAASAAVIGSAIAAAPVLASPGNRAFVCNSTWVYGQTFTNVSVPSGATCNLVDDTVAGSVAVGAGSQVLFCGGTVDGNVSAIDSTQVQFVCGTNPATVMGNVDIEGGADQVTLSPANIDGNLNIDSVTVDTHIQSLTVGGNMALTNDSHVWISDTAVTKDLNCFGNGIVQLNGAIDSTPLSVGGTAYGQCAALAG